MRAFVRCFLFRGFFCASHDGFLRVRFIYINCVLSLPANICFSHRSVNCQWHPSLLATRLILFQNIHMTADARARRMACLLLPPLSLLVCYCCQSCHCGEPCSYCSCHQRPCCSPLLARRSQTHNSLGQRAGFGVPLQHSHLRRGGGVRGIKEIDATRGHAFCAGRGLPEQPRWP